MVFVLLHFVDILYSRIQSVPQFAFARDTLVALAQLLWVSGAAMPTRLAVLQWLRMLHEKIPSEVMAEYREVTYLPK